MRPISLDELIALNDEIRGLVRAGVPLESGLRWLGSDLPGRLGQLASSMSARLERGESLVDVVDDSQRGFPRLYRAVVAAGMRSGRLAAALEGLAVTARRAAEVRRIMIVSLIYPIFLLIIAGGVLSFTANKTAPVVAEIYAEFDYARPWWYEEILRWFSMSDAAILLMWLGLAVMGGAWWYWSNRAVSLTWRSGWGVPTIARLRQMGRLATFTDVLALLIENATPLDEAVVLAAEASGDAGLSRASKALAEHIRSGNSGGNLPRGVPPLLGWMLTSRTPQSQLVRSLRQSADNYQRRAFRMGSWLTVYLPILLAGLIGGTVTLAYCLAVIAPFYHLLYLLSY